MVEIYDDDEDSGDDYVEDDDYDDDYDYDDDDDDDDGYDEYDTDDDVHCILWYCSNCMWAIFGYFHAISLQSMGNYSKSTHGTVDMPYVSHHFSGASHGDIQYLESAITLCDYSSLSSLVDGSICREYCLLYSDNDDDIHTDNKNFNASSQTGKWINIFKFVRSIASTTHKE